MIVAYGKFAALPRSTTQVSRKTNEERELYIPVSDRTLKKDDFPTLGRPDQTSIFIAREISTHGRRES